MKLFIPVPGTKLRILKRWQFDLYVEHRNKTLIEALGLDYAAAYKAEWMERKAYWQREYDARREMTPEAQAERPWPNQPPPAILARPIISRGEILTVDRLYVRRGESADFNSISFRALVKGKRVRFWAKLADCERLDVEVVP